MAAMTAMVKTETYLDSTPLLENPKALRERAAKDGNLYFKKLIDPKAVLNVRRQEIGRAHV